MQQAYIKFHQVWKRFRRGEVHDSLRDLLPAVGRGLFRVARRDQSTLRLNEFWALRDVDFEVRPGQALGIIGGNGAGKSTCLKLLTRILRPTYGAIEVKGRIGSLIEISAGFHPDLTGRENVFLQGSIMGMRIARIKEKFDEIVDFSGIGEFLDTPVKRYSSGMQARLGFAIAAHLDPDVLIIDEVLAVGDSRYQDRAFGRIRELVSSGIPVAIVSHQLDRIATLCTDVLVLDHGVVAFRGPPVESIGWYLAGSHTVAVDPLHPSAIQLVSMKVVGGRTFDSGDRVCLDLRGVVREGGPRDEHIVLRVYSTTTAALVAGITTEQCSLPPLEEGPVRIEISFELNLRPGVYAVEPFVVDRVTGNDCNVGPNAYVQVREDPGFIGTAQLRPEMQLISAPAESSPPSLL